MVIDREDENGDILTVEFFSISSTIYYASCMYIFDTNIYLYRSYIYKIYLIEVYANWNKKFYDVLERAWCLVGLE